MPDRRDIAFDSRIKETLDALHGRGALLVTQGQGASRPNAMTIGWGVIGYVWGLPIFQVLVRPSRHSFEMLKTHGDFTVNILGDEHADALAYCGSASGRDHDKLAEMDLTVAAGKSVTVPFITQAKIVYECRTVMTAEVQAGKLDPAILTGSYKAGDYHRVYFGRILATHAE